MRRTGLGRVSGPGMGRVYNYEYAKCQATEKCGFKLHEIIASHSATNEISDTTCPQPNGVSPGAMAASAMEPFSFRFVSFRLVLFVFLFLIIFLTRIRRGLVLVDASVLGGSNWFAYFVNDYKILSMFRITNWVLTIISAVSLAALAKL